MPFDAYHRILVSPPTRIALVSLVMTGFISASSADTEDQKFDLRPRTSLEETREVHVVIEVTGDLKLNADGQKVDRVRMRVSGDLRYDERTLRPRTDSQSKRDVRFYHDARATIAIGDTRLGTGLNDNRRLVIADDAATSLTLYSPLGPMTRDELELIHTQGSSSFLDRLAPDEPVALNETWEHDAADLAILLALDAIHQTDVKSSLRQVEGHTAIVDMKGNVSGAIDGVATDIALKAKYNIDLESHHVTWLAMSVREKRAIGHATPGFDVTARIRVEVNEAQATSELSDSLLNELPLDLTAGSTLLRLDSAPGGFDLLQARSWRVMVDRHDVSILRMIEQGELIAQCNLSSLPDLPAGKHVQLKSFQADIEKALGKNFGHFVEASQQRSENGDRILRAVVSGLASELPIQWIYYHISNDAGRQTAIVFTLDAKVIEKFAGADESIIGSFRFADRVSPTPTRAAAKPTTVR